MAGNRRVAGIADHGLAGIALGHHGPRACIGECHVEPGEPVIDRKRAVAGGRTDHGLGARHRHDQRAHRIDNVAGMGVGQRHAVGRWIHGRRNVDALDLPALHGDAHRSRLLGIGGGIGIGSRDDQALQIAPAGSGSTARARKDRRKARKLDIDRDLVAAGPDIAVKLRHAHGKAQQRHRIARPQGIGQRGSWQERRGQNERAGKTGKGPEGHQTKPCDRKTSEMKLLISPDSLRIRRFHGLCPPDLALTHGSPSTIHPRPTHRALDPGDAHLPPAAHPSELPLHMGGLQRNEV